MPVAQKKLFQQKLHAWFRVHKRDLPWRRKPTLYKTVVSEIMLQQTQVKTVIPYLERWLKNFPDFAALAAAPEEKVLKNWEGLGYYTRARNLHKLARQVAAMPVPPHTPEDWRKLPGIGPYTAAAITSITYNAPAAVVDGNVIRILTRLTADPEKFPNNTAALKKLTPLAQELLPEKNPGEHNEAMMELGATLCTKHNPQCLLCPVNRLCAAAKNGNPETFPRIAKPKTEQLTHARIWTIKNQKLLLHQIPATSRRLADLHELPAAVDLGISEKQLAAQKPLITQKRAITRYTITEHIHEIPPSKIPDKLPPHHHWIPLKQLSAITLSGPHRRLLQKLLH